MTLRETLYNSFTNCVIDDVFPVNGFSKEYPCFTFKNKMEYGVLIPISLNIDVDEKFAGMNFYTATAGIIGNTIVLSTDNRELMSNFTLICEDLVNTDPDGIRRESIIANPMKWWEDWKKLMGNVSSNPEPYSLIGEMLIADFMSKKNELVKWDGPEGSVIDILGNTFDAEVKSTLKRYESSITISSQYQLSNTKPLKIFFCRFEPNRNGISINSMLNILINDGIDITELENKLDAAGYAKGRFGRDKKYKLLEIREYDVDSSFPKITAESFKNDRITPGIIHITYEVDLDCIDYTNVNCNCYQEPF